MLALTLAGIAVTTACSSDSTIPTASCNACAGASYSPNDCQTWGSIAGCKTSAFVATVAGCTNGCSLTPPTCQEVNGQLWCFNNDACGESCNEVCEALGYTIVISDDEWFQLQDEMDECSELAEAFGLPGIDMNSYTYACLEDSGINDARNRVPVTWSRRK